MKMRNWLAGLAIATVPALSSFGQESVAELQAKLDAQNARIASLEAANNDQWVSKRRAEEIKQVVKEVLADAETRQDMSGVMAGYESGKGFFIRGSGWNLNLGGQIQVRYVYNRRDVDAADEGEQGFEVRRTKLAFSGSNDIGWYFKVVGAFARTGGASTLEDALIGKKFGDSGFAMQVGQFKGPFMDDELVSSRYQQAVERAYLTDYFTMDFVQGAQVSWSKDDSPFRAAFMFHDGSYQTNGGYSADTTNAAFAGRVEFRVSGGDWKRFDDYQSWEQDSELALKIGAAADYEIGETGTATNTQDLFKWTVDARGEVSIFNFMGAFVGQQLMDNSSPLLSEAVQWGAMAQVGVFIIPNEMDLFARYEFIDFNNAVFTAATGTTVFPQAIATDEECQIITFGGNYYFKKHDAKFTADVMWTPDSLPVGDSGAGLLEAEGNHQFTLRFQLQLLW